MWVVQVRVINSRIVASWSCMSWEQMLVLLTHSSTWSSHSCSSGLEWYETNFRLLTFAVFEVMVAVAFVPISVLGDDGITIPPLNVLPKWSVDTAIPATNNQMHHPEVDRYFLGVLLTFLAIVCSLLLSRCQNCHCSWCVWEMVLDNHSSLPIAWTDSKILLVHDL